MIRINKAPARLLAAVGAMLLLSGCASYIEAKQEVAQSGQTIAAAEARRDAEIRRNADLRSQVEAAEQAQRAMAADVGRKQAQLVQISDRLAKSRSATGAQRRELERLTQLQNTLRKDVEALQAAPPPATAGDVGARQLELDNLRMEAERLQKQIDALQSAL